MDLISKFIYIVHLTSTIMHTIREVRNAIPKIQQVIGMTWSPNEIAYPIAEVEKIISGWAKYCAHYEGYVEYRDYDQLVGRHYHFIFYIINKRRWFITYSGNEFFIKPRLEFEVSEKWMKYIKKDFGKPGTKYIKSSKLKTTLETSLLWQSIAETNKHPRESAETEFSTRSASSPVR